MASRQSGWPSASYYPGATKKSPPSIQRFYWGETVQGNGQLPDNQTVFGIGSVGKVFTTTLLADMVVNQKLLALDDLVQPYYDKVAPGRVTLPTFKGQGIRFIDLATHTAGLPDQPKSLHDDACGTPISAVYDFLNNFKLPQAPGTVASYSDLGFDLLSDILNLISGSTSRDQSLHDLLTRAKLPMPNTGSITLPLQQDSHYATGYDVDSKGTLSAAPLLTCDSGSDHVGQVASTLDDMIEWAQFNLGLTKSPFNTLLPLLQKTGTSDGGTDRWGGARLATASASERRENQLLREGWLLGTRLQRGYGLCPDAWHGQRDPCQRERDRCPDDQFENSGSRQQKHWHNRFPTPLPSGK